MSSKTKIVVLHLKEVIYTAIFAVLGILFLVLMVLMFLPGKESDGPGMSEEPQNYIPGKYTSTLQISDTSVDVEVVVDANQITSIRMVNLNEVITTMYPLMEPALDELSAQIYEKQSLKDITYPDENKYTSMILLEAIQSALDKAAVPEAE